MAALDMGDMSKSVKKASGIFDSVISNGLRMQKLMESTCLELMPVLKDDDKQEYLNIVQSCKMLRDDTHAELNGITLLIRHFVDSTEEELESSERDSRFESLVGKINSLFPTLDPADPSAHVAPLAIDGAPPLPPRTEGGVALCEGPSTFGGEEVAADLPRTALELRAASLHDRVIRFRENLRSAGYAARVVSQLLTSVVTSLVCLGGGVAAASGVIIGAVGAISGGVGSLAGLVGLLVAFGVPILLGAGALAVGSACLGISSAVGMVKGALMLKKSDKLSKKMQKECAEVQRQMIMLKTYAGAPGSPKIFAELSDSLRESVWKLE